MDNPEVQVTVETTTVFSAEEILRRAAEVYQGLTAEQIANVETIALDRRHFFREQGPNEGQVFHSRICFLHHHSASILVAILLDSAANAMRKQRRSLRRWTMQRTTD